MKSVEEHWDDPKVESQYDKHLMHAEIGVITKHIEKYICETATRPPLILDIGCGECEAVRSYSQLPEVYVCAVDRSETRLKLARKNLKGKNNIELVQASVTDSLPFPDETFDIIVSQRCLINLLTDEERLKAAAEILRVCKQGGQIILLEGSTKGHEELNKAREHYDLPPIEVKWHNRFFSNEEILSLFRSEAGIIGIDQSLGGYLYLTRVVKPALLPDMPWDCRFNSAAGHDQVLKGVNGCARLTAWILQKDFTGRSAG